MLLFIDNPVGLIIFLMLVLILFGPQKVPEMAGQLGRAIRELKRATSDFTNAMHGEDTHTSYDPPRYDQHSSSGYVSHTPDPHSYETNTVGGSHDGWRADAPEYKSQAAIASGTSSAAVVGDHAASAFAGHDGSDEEYHQSAHNATMTAPITTPPPSGDVYGVVESPTSSSSSSSPITVRPADSAVPRQN